MFESAELGHRIDKATYDAEVPQLREDLLNAQFDLAQKAKFPVIILIGGVDGAGKGETVNLLNAWMDPRHIVAHAMGEQSDEERERPPMWRFWRALPPKGKIGVFFGSWYTAPIVRRVMGKIKASALDQSIDEINRFEKMLTNEGALIVKFWFHLAKDVQRKRLKSLEKDPKTRWRVTELDWERFKLYDKFRKVSEHALRATSTAEAPWIVVEGADPRYRSLTTGKTLLQALRKRLDHPAQPVPSNAPPLQAAIDRLDVFDKLDMTQKITRKKFDADLEKYQGKLNLLTRDERFRSMSVIALFEGSDAAGKGGAIRRITGALDARHYRIIPVAAPTEEERAQPYLWRFWRHIPRTGRVTIFDRSWYGRVLVERVEKFCSEADWMRAYGELNDFEEQLVRNNTVLVKFWLTITKDEQLRRFKEREKTGFKRFKITDEDWRNRKRWNEYEHAVCDMVDRTSTELAPWTLVEANDKNFARIKILKTLCQQIEAAMKRK
ncbi:MAG: polyphosphate:AMP phosphotransferase [Gallionellales bacterium RIFCSPHIGHO2_02_FULL_57_16]|nr:MAG: polyphosphate:AMP phosphotransferase [Gallionellales bacterium RIFCSPHIGHO2_02_FULL_57_16]